MLHHVMIYENVLRSLIDFTSLNCHLSAWSGREWVEDGTASAGQFCTINLVVVVYSFIIALMKCLKSNNSVFTNTVFM